MRRFLYPKTAKSTQRPHPRGPNLDETTVQSFENKSNALFCREERPCVYSEQMMNNGICIVKLMEGEMDFGGDSYCPLSTLPLSLSLSLWEALW